MNNDNDNFLSREAQRSRAMARFGVQELVAPSDNPREYNPLLLAVHGLLGEAENALGCHQLAEMVNLIPTEIPSGAIVASRVEAEGTVYNPGATNWDEIRAIYEPVLRRALWGYALIKFCAAMPRSSDATTYEHTQNWLKEHPVYKPYFTRYWEIRNWQEAHAGASDSPKGGKISQFDASTDAEVAAVSFEEWEPDPSINYHPMREDGQILRLLIISASEFTVSEIRNGTRRND